MRSLTLLRDSAHAGRLRMEGWVQATPQIFEPSHASSTLAWRWTDAKTGKA